MRAGLRLRWFGAGNPDYSLGDLVAFVSTLPVDSALQRELLGDDAGWTLDTDLLALVADQLAMLRYQLTGPKGAEKPQLVSRFANKPAPTATTVPDAAADSPAEDLNDRNKSGRFTGQIRSTAEIARDLGWV